MGWATKPKRSHPEGVAMVGKEEKQDAGDGEDVGGVPAGSAPSTPFDGGIDDTPDDGGPDLDDSDHDTDIQDGQTQSPWDPYDDEHAGTPDPGTPALPGAATQDPNDSTTEIIFGDDEAEVITPEDGEVELVDQVNQVFRDDPLGRTTPEPPPSDGPELYNSGPPANSSDDDRARWLEEHMNELNDELRHHTPHREHEVEQFEVDPVTDLIPD
jgi:hypothetical protein